MTIVNNSSHPDLRPVSRHPLRRLSTSHPRIFQTGANGDVRGLYDTAHRNYPERVRDDVRALLPEYRPTVAKVPAQAAPYADDH